MQAKARGAGRKRRPGAWALGLSLGAYSGAVRAESTLSFCPNHLFQDRFALISIFKRRPLLFQLAVR